MVFYIIIAVVVVSSLILLFVGLLLYARSKLAPTGKVSIDINDGEKVIETELGGTLLVTMSQNGVFLPSACGGGGTCGLCKCQVLEGGGDILPTETGFFSRKQQKEHWRLSCQLKVREDLKLHIDEAVLGVRKWECEVVANENVATYITEFVVKLPEGENLKFRSGQYVQIDVPRYSGLRYRDMDISPEYREDWDGTKMWGLVASNSEPTYRAYSMANHPAEGNIIMLNVRIATPPWDRAAGAFQNVPPGICSSYIFSLKPGDKITMSGPFGDFFLRDTPNEKLFVGGGAGMAPMRSHIFHLFRTMHTDIPVSFWYGARSRREIFYEKDFEDIAGEFTNFKFNIALSAAKPEDNWTGYTGFIHQVIYDEYLKNHPAPEDIEYYLCGPAAMTDAAIKMLDNLGVPPENIMFDDFG